MNNLLLGAIVGDVCGSYYEWKRTKNPKNVDLFRNDTSFTDDTIGTIATADAIMNNKSFTETYQEWFRKYNAKGCGKLFKQWVFSNNPQPYGSWGNGSAMRISPIGYLTYLDSIQIDLKVLESVCCTHNTVEAIKGAKCVVDCIMQAYLFQDKESIKYDFFAHYYPEYVDKTLDELRTDYHFDSSCQGSVPHSVLCFLESESYEDCIIKAISMGGDADTMAAIAGSIAYTFYGKMSVRLAEFVLSKLPNEMIKIINDFDKFIGEQ